jgi:cobalamin biosynthesis protein CobD/CbiB
VLRGRILSVRERLHTMGQPDLSERLEEALRALERGQTAEYRRLVNHVVSRLGHLPAS